MSVESFKLGGVEFRIDMRPGKDRGISTTNSFILVKNQRFYRDWRFKKPSTIMEVGLFEGGSLVLFDKLFSPSKIVGVDIRRNPIEPLEEYRVANPHVVTYYSRSQDKPGTWQAARQNFPAGIDLVIDDASHLYEQTRATFEMLFPLVAPGGNYVIEDWAWSHRPGAQDNASVWAEKKSTTNLIMELVVMAASYGVVDSIHVQQELICITKGRGKLPDNPFDLSARLRGREMTEL
jgi:Cephalosporin hydroxylase